eukprot:3933479-Rhodomonas_salina.1
MDAKDACGASTQSVNTIGPSKSRSTVLVQSDKRRLEKSSAYSFDLDRGVVCRTGALLLAIKGRCRHKSAVVKLEISRCYADRVAAGGVGQNPVVVRFDLLGEVHDVE